MLIGSVSLCEQSAYRDRVLFVQHRWFSNLLFTLLLCLSPLVSHSQSLSLRANNSSPLNSSPVVQSTVDEFEEVFQSGRAWSFTFENDIFVGDDDGLTNAFAFQLGRAAFDRFTPENLPAWLYRLVGDTYINRPDGGGKRGVVYTFGQAMQTPEDIQSSDPLPGELPYAGLVFASASFYAAGPIRSNRLTLVGGMVGPVSLAAESQALIHRITGSEIPNGWDNQIDYEPVFMVEAGKIFRALSTDPDRSLEFDTILLADIGLGNLRSSASATVLVRIGDNLEISYPLASVLPDRQVSPLAFSKAPSWYAFAGVQAAYIANDIMIDGNTFSDSLSVPLDHTQGRLSLGLGWNLGSWAFTVLFSENQNTRERDPFGSISVTHRYQ